MYRVRCKNPDTGEWLELTTFTEAEARRWAGLALAHGFTECAQPKWVKG